MTNQRLFVPVISRAGRPDSELEAKEVKVGHRRYVVCRNWRRPGATPSVVEDARYDGLSALQTDIRLDPFSVTPH